MNLTKETKEILIWLIVILIIIYVLKKIRNNRNIIDNLNTKIPMPGGETKGTTDSVYHDDSKIKVFATTCIDLRFIDEEQGFLTKIYGRDLYDSFVLPGVGLALYDKYWQHDILETGNLIDVGYYNSWWKTALIAKALHGIKTIVVIDHEECGYYKRICIPDNNIPTSEINIYNIDTVEKYTDMLPKLADFIEHGVSVPSVNNTSIYNYSAYEKSKYNTFKTLDLTHVENSAFIYEKEMAADEKLVYDKLNFMVKLWQKAIHVMVLSSTLKGLMHKRAVYNTVLSDTTNKTPLAGSLLNDVKFEGYLMKMDGTTEKVFPL